MSDVVKRNTIFNLRNHPFVDVREAVKDLDDERLFELYEEFAMSDMYGNNDENFAVWLNGSAA